MSPPLSSYASSSLLPLPSFATAVSSFTILNSSSRPVSSTSTLSRLRARSTPRCSSLPTQEPQAAELVVDLKLSPPSTSSRPFTQDLSRPRPSRPQPTLAVAVAVVNIFKTVRSRPQWDTDRQALKTSNSLFKILSPSSSLFVVIVVAAAVNLQGHQEARSRFRVKTSVGYCRVAQVRKASRFTKLSRSSRRSSPSRQIPQVSSPQNSSRPRWETAQEYQGDKTSSLKFSSSSSRHLVEDLSGRLVKIQVAARPQDSITQWDTAQDIARPQDSRRRKTSVGNCSRLKTPQDLSGTLLKSQDPRRQDLSGKLLKMLQDLKIQDAKTSVGNCSRLKTPQDLSGTLLKSSSATCSKLRFGQVVPQALFKLAASAIKLILRMPAFSFFEGLQASDLS
ncbi:hypothetical protein B0H16DRAFT_1470716 [Mycena metata]|uniref:Uncharacterized protein n=1 Tax=Mycena metata TaxID=1033252 RepID=A0AAD7HTK1_9AGAR|nr:hypothetical protein B0H16DRAFT_1470716 [Mycena metata]